MNSIVYMSDAYQNYYPENTNTNFKCFVEEKKLEYIPFSSSQKTEISIAIKSITVSIPKEQINELKEKKIVVNSNLCIEPNVKSSDYSKILSIFTITNSNYNQEFETLDYYFSIMTETIEIYAEPIPEIKSKQLFL